MKKDKALMKKDYEEYKPKKVGRPKKRKVIDDEYIPPPPKKNTAVPANYPLRSRPMDNNNQVNHDSTPVQNHNFSSASSGSSKNCNPCAEIVAADTSPNPTTELADTKCIIEKVHSFGFTEMAVIMNHDSHDIDDDDDVVESFIHPALINVHGYYVKQETVFLLKKIFKTHGDVGKNCEIKCGKSRGLFIEMMCSVYKKLEENSLKEITEIEIEGMLAIVNVLQNMNFDVKWLCERLKDISGIKNLFKEHSLMKKEDAKKTEAIMKKEKEIDEYKEKLFIAEGELVILNDEFDKVNRVNKSLMEKGCVFWKNSLVHGLV